MRGRGQNEARLVRRIILSIIQVSALAVFGTGCFSTVPDRAEEADQSSESLVPSESDTTSEAAASSLLDA